MNRFKNERGVQCHCFVIIEVFQCCEYILRSYTLRPAISPSPYRHHTVKPAISPSPYRHFNRAYVSFPAADSTGKPGLDPTLQQEYLDHLEQVFCVGPSGLPAVSASGLPAVSPSGLPAVSPSGLPAVSPSEMAY